MIGMDIGDCYKYGLINDTLDLLLPCAHLVNIGNVVLCKLISKYLNGERINKSIVIFGLLSFVTGTYVAVLRRVLVFRTPRVL